MLFRRNPSATAICKHMLVDARHYYPSILTNNNCLLKLESQTRPCLIVL